MSDSSLSSVDRAYRNTLRWVRDLSRALQGFSGDGESYRTYFKVMSAPYVLHISWRIFIDSRYPEFIAGDAVPLIQAQLRQIERLRVVRDLLRGLRFRSFMQLFGTIGERVLRGDSAQWEQTHRLLENIYQNSVDLRVTIPESELPENTNG